MNFSKEYIKECDCEEIQGLVDELNFNYFAYRNLKYNKGVYKVYNHYMKDVIEFNRNRNEIIYLPTGDQLDNEIVKICREKELYYSMTYFGDAVKDRGELFYIFNVSTPVRTIEKQKDDIDLTQQNNSPLIPKIKLLKALLKEAK